MTKLYKDLTTEELKQAIKGLEDNQSPQHRAYERTAEGITLLERYQKELERRAQS